MDKLCNATHVVVIEKTDAVTPDTQEQSAQAPAVQAVAVEQAGKKAAAQTKRTKNMVLPHLVDLVVGKATMKDVTKALSMSEAEVGKQVSDIFGPILNVFADVAKELGDASRFFVMMEKKPEHSVVLMEMLKDTVEGSHARLCKLAGKV